VQRVKTLLSKEPQDRTKVEIRELEEYFKNNPFFEREAARARDNQTIQNLFTHLKVLEYQKGDTVFKFGDRGQLFYIIIDGEIEIRTPAPVELENEQATPEGILVFCITYFNEIYWDKMLNGDKIQSKILNELEMLQITVTNKSFDKDKALKALDHAVVNGHTKIHLKLEQSLNPNHKPSITLNWFKTVQTLRTGASFGERALIKNEDRAATIVCSKNSCFATLHRKDYNAIIGASQKRELKEKVEILKNFRIFSQLRTNVLEKI